VTGGNGEDDRDDGPDDAEPRGMAGVDVDPMPPLDREGVEALRKERDDLRDQLLRRRADFENYKRRVERDREQAGLDALTSALKGLIPSLDNLERALEAHAGEEALRQGVELTHREILSFLEKQGVKVEDPTGQRFDPERHQALSHEPVPGQPEGTVVEVYRKGYALKDRLLRPALVKVAAGGGASGKDTEAVH
jgi:molecular chaperone GrpE